MRVVSLEVLMSFYLGFFQILEGSEGEGNRLKITFTSKAGIIKKGRRTGYGFVYCDWDLIEIRFNTD